jgi:hypothetical protein
LPQQIPEPVSSRKYGKIFSYECEWAFRYQFFAAEAPRVLISHIFLLKGTVQQKLRGVESYINQKDFVSH